MADGNLAVVGVVKRQHGGWGKYDVWIHLQPAHRPYVCGPNVYARAFKHGEDLSQVIEAALLDFEKSCPDHQGDLAICWHGFGDSAGWVNAPGRGGHRG